MVVFVAALFFGAGDFFPKHRLDRIACLVLLRSRAHRVIGDGLGQFILAQPSAFPEMPDELQRMEVPDARRESGLLPELQILQMVDERLISIGLFMERLIFLLEPFVARLIVAAVPFRREAADGPAQNVFPRA